MESLRTQRLLFADAPPVWTRHRDLCGFRGRPRHIVWQNALRPILPPQLLDRRGIAICSEEMMHRRRRHIAGWIADMLGLRQTEGWRKGTQAIVAALIGSFYAPFGHRAAWVMVESCRDPIRKRNPGLTERLTPYTKPAITHPATAIGRAELRLKSGVQLPSRGLRLAVPAGRRMQRMGLVRSEVERVLATPGGSLEGQITSWCLAEAGADDADLAQGYVPCGLQCLIPGGVNAARLITLFRMEPELGWTETYAIDLDAATGQVLSLRYQFCTLRMMVELDPWLDDWLLTALRFG